MKVKVVTLAALVALVLGCQPKRTWDNPLEPYRNQPPSVPVLVSPATNASGILLNPHLVWRSSAFAGFYDLQLSPRADFSLLSVEMTGMADTVCRVSDLDTNRIYYWRVRAGNPAGYSDWSPPADFRTASIQEILQNGMVACYRFSGDILDSLGVFNGTGFGYVFATDRFGVANRAVYFDGINDRIYVTRMVQDDFTISFWFRSDQGVGTSTQWFDGAGMVDAEYSGITDDFGTSLNANGRVLAGTGNPDIHVYSSTGYNDNQWHFVAFTRLRSSGRLCLYVDGALQSNAVGGVQELSRTPVIMMGGLQTLDHYYRGLIDDVRIYNRDLTPLEVHCLYLIQ